MKKNCLLLILVLSVMSLQAAHYPDSVQEASKQQFRIEKGWNFEFAGGVGLSQIAYQHWGQVAADKHVSNKLFFPAINANVGISYYFVPFMGIGTGVHFSTYSSRASFGQPWEGTFTDRYNDSYQQTMTMTNLEEQQRMYFLEIPVALKFRAMPQNKRVGFIGTLGVKFALPMYNRYESQTTGILSNEVYYPGYDLRMQGNIPTVLEGASIPSYYGRIAKTQMSSLNFVGYVELGALFQIHQRVDISLSAFANYYINDVVSGLGRQEIGFGNYLPAGEYQNLSVYNTAYSSIINSGAVQSLHPWSVGLKVGLQINASRTDAQKEYDRKNRKKKTKEEESAPVVVQEETEDWWTKHCEENKQQILLLARECNIDLVELAGYDPTAVHDTIMIFREVPSVGAVRQIEEHLQKAVIFFNLDDTVPILQPADILERVAEVLIYHPELAVEVNGHSCKLGKPAYNKRLALRRAEAVANELNRLGVSYEQMKIQSKGANEPFRYNNGKHQLEQDRRVELIPYYRVPESIWGLEEIHTQTDETDADMSLTPKTNQPNVREQDGKIIETVIPGSRLAQIARRHYGNPHFWVYIYDANRSIVSDPRDIRVGTELVIPDLSELQQGQTKEEALIHAKDLEQQYLQVLPPR